MLERTFLCSEGRFPRGETNHSVHSAKFPEPGVNIFSQFNQLDGVERRTGTWKSTIHLRKFASDSYSNYS